MCLPRLNGLGIRTYVPEPESKYERKWTDKSPLERKAVENNRRRMKRTYGKKLQRRRSEVVERTFAHTCETGGARRMWLRGLESAKKQYLLTAVGNNLGLVMRKLLGSGKPRMWGMLAGVFLCLWNALRALLTSLHDPQDAFPIENSLLTPSRTGLPSDPRNLLAEGDFSTGC